MAKDQRALAEIAPPRRRGTDPYFREEYRSHVGRSITCVCMLEGPDKDCDRGHALWEASQPRKWGDN